MDTRMAKRSEGKTLSSKIPRARPMEAMMSPTSPREIMHTPRRRAPMRPKPARRAPAPVPTTLVRMLAAIRARA